MTTTPLVSVTGAWCAPSNRPSLSSGVAHKTGPSFDFLRPIPSQHEKRLSVYAELLMWFPPFACHLGAPERQKAPCLLPRFRRSMP